jgi:hypothetical protein
MEFLWVDFSYNIFRGKQFSKDISRKNDFFNELKISISPFLYKFQRKISRSFGENFAEKSTRYRLPQSNDKISFFLDRF